MVAQKGKAVVDCRDVRLLWVQLQLQARKGLSGQCQGVLGLLSSTTSAISCLACSLLLWVSQRRLPDPC